MASGANHEIEAPGAADRLVCWMGSGPNFTPIAGRRPLSPAAPPPLAQDNALDEKKARHLVKAAGTDWIRMMSDCSAKFSECEYFISLTFASTGLAKIWISFLTQAAFCARLLIFQGVHQIVCRKRMAFRWDGRVLEAQSGTAATLSADRPFCKELRADKNWERPELVRACQRERTGRQSNELIREYFWRAMRSLIVIAALYLCTATGIYPLLDE